MEKKIYDERALRTFKANFEKVRDRLVHIHECDLGLVGFRSELIVQLYKACDYRCLYQIMPLHGISMMEQGRLVSKCSDYIVRDFICYFLNSTDFHFDCLLKCCDGLYRDGDVEYHSIVYKSDGKLWAEILDLKSPHSWFDELPDELKRGFDKEKREIWNRYVGEDDAITEGRILKLKVWYGMGWKTALEWVRDKHRMDELKNFIWDTYVKKDVSAVAKKKLEEHIDFCGDDENWWLDESFESVYNCRGRIRKWFDDPRVQKDFILSGKEIGNWLKEKKAEWLKVKCS
jgi:hypothetical protein